MDAKVKANVKIISKKSANEPNKLIISSNFLLNNKLLTVAKRTIQTTVDVDNNESLCREIPYLEEGEAKNLDNRGIVLVGTYVRQGDILVGKVKAKMTLPKRPKNAF